MLRVVVDTHLQTFHLSASFSAERGKTTILLGESGAGKSTILRLIAGLLQPEQGYISFDDYIYFDSERQIMIPPQQRPFGYVFQDYVLFPHLTVFENVAFGLRAQHLPRKIIHKRVGEALEQVRLAGLDQRHPAQISGGQQQRVAIARALALQPQLLLLDEPLAALDVQTRRDVRQELHRILTEVNITTVLVTHQYLEALLFGENILVLDHGHVLQQGGLRDLLEYPRSPYVAELVGVNFFRGHIVRIEANTMCVVRLQNGMHTIEVVAALREQNPDRIPTVGEEGSIVVHPRNITLYPSPPDSSARNVFRGMITHILHLGSNSEEGSVRISIMVDGTTSPLTAEITEASATRLDLREGKSIYAAFKATEANAYV